MPTSLCPSSVKATVEGVVLIPMQGGWGVTKVLSHGEGWLTFGVLDDLGVVGLHDSDARVGGAQIDSDNAI